MNASTHAQIGLIIHQFKTKSYDALMQHFSFNNVVTRSLHVTIIAMNIERSIIEQLD